MSDSGLVSSGGNPLFESILNDNTEGCDLVVTPTLFSWTEVRTVFGFNRSQFDSQNASLSSSTGLFTLRNVYDNMAPQYLVKVGDYRPGYGGDATLQGVGGVSSDQAVAVRVGLRSRSERDTVNFDQSIVYMQPGPNCEVSYEVYQQSEVRNFAEDHTGWGPQGAGTSPDTRITAISYVAAGAQGVMQQQGTNANVPIVANITVPTVLRSVRVTQYEVLQGLTPSNILWQERPIWNNKPCFGFKVGTLLYMGVASQTDGTSLYKRTYTFLINQYGWHHFYAVYQMANGFVPYMITPIDPSKVEPLQGTYNSLISPDLFGPTLKNNGTGAFRMLPNADLNVLLPQLKPPFNDTTVVPPATAFIDTGLESNIPQPGQQ